MAEKDSNPFQISNLPETFSLLFPISEQEHEYPASLLNRQTIIDLELRSLLKNIYGAKKTDSSLEKIFFKLSLDKSVIAYRQDIFEDLLGQYQLYQGLFNILPELEALQFFSAKFSKEDSEAPPVFKVINKLSEMESFVKCVCKLHDLFSLHLSSIRSSAFKKLFTIIKGYKENITFSKLARELPEMIGQIRGIQSITVGINLNPQLQPKDAVLLAINDKQFKESKLYSRLFGGDTFTGIAPFHSVKQKPKPLIGTGLMDLSEAGTPVLTPLYHDLSVIVSKICNPILTRLKDYLRINTHILSHLKVELEFYLGYVKMINEMQAKGFPFCRPEIIDMSERICEIKNSYNLNLALSMSSGSKAADDMVTNDINLNQQGRIAILTGPNQGGKTVYTQAAGLVQVMTQIGLPVPGTCARISMADAIYTHYQIDEQPAKNLGRLGEEASRLSDIFTRISEHSLVLLNESLSSTNAGESIYIAEDIIKVLSILGARVIFATHLHDLAAKADILNQETNGKSRIISLVSHVTEDKNKLQNEQTIKRTFKIFPGPPHGHSYAKELASRFGISFNQLLQVIEKK
ncbi:MAG: hypothetical protein MJB14_13525 [Spirochaetes bacterium]|nr:hypothetical protein [Spirochaetota bacterium]